MNPDRWASRLGTAKRQQNSQLDDNEEVWSDLPCPYCYEGYDIDSVCIHLEEEHPCEPRSTGCSICCIKVTRDILNHITVQHGHLLKFQKHRRLRRVGVPNTQALSLLGRDPREAQSQVLLSSGACASDAATDPLLSSLLLSSPSSEEEDSESIVSIAEDTYMKNVTSINPWKLSTESSLSREEKEQRITRATARAGFMQGLLLSTLVGD